MKNPSVLPPIGKEASSKGFTLVELLIGAVLLAVAGSAAALLVGVSNRSLVRTEAYANASAAIESDIARIRDLSERYTCCDGVCSTTPTTPKCSFSSVGDSSYYFPSPTSATKNADIVTFQNFCTATTAGNSLTNELIGLINGLPQPTGVTRATAVNDNASDIPQHLINVTYTATSPGVSVSRVVKIVPTVSGWCP